MNSGIPYNKVYKKKDGRVLVASGPRNSQSRLARQTPSELQDTSSEELTLLRNQVEQLTEHVNGGTYSKDQVNDIINAALEEVTAELEEKYINEINSLKALANERQEIINKLESKIDSKDATIEKLTNQLVNSKPTVIYSSNPDNAVTQNTTNRPQLDSVFVDPSTKGDEDRFESHINVAEVKSEKKAVNADIDKLKALLGSKLPVKK